MILGVYGNIASGKSTVCNYLYEKYKFKYLSLDKLANSIMENNQDLLTELINLKKTGIDVITKDGKNIDSKKLKKIIFYNKKLNNTISKIIWKYVKKETEKYIQDNKKSNLVIEAAVLPTLKLKEIDYYLYVQTDQYHYKNYLEIAKLIKIQNAYNRYKRKDYVIQNNSTIKELHQQVDKIMLNYLNQK